MNALTPAEQVAASGAWAEVAAKAAALKRQAQAQPQTPEVQKALNILDEVERQSHRKLRILWRLFGGGGAKLVALLVLSAALLGSPELLAAGFMLDAEIPVKAFLPFVSFSFLAFFLFFLEVVQSPSDSGPASRRASVIGLLWIVFTFLAVVSFLLAVLSPALAHFLELEFLRDWLNTAATWPQAPLVELAVPDSGSVTAIISEFVDVDSVPASAVFDMPAPAVFPDLSPAALGDLSGDVLSVAAAGVTVVSGTSALSPEEEAEVSMLEPRLTWKGLREMMNLLRTRSADFPQAFNRGGTGLLVATAMLFSPEEEVEVLAAAQHLKSDVGAATYLKLLREVVDHASSEGEARTSDEEPSSGGPETVLGNSETQLPILRPGEYGIPGGVPHVGEDGSVIPSSRIFSGNNGVVNGAGGATTEAQYPAAVPATGLQLAGGDPSGAGSSTAQLKEREALQMMGAVVPTISAGAQSSPNITPGVRTIGGPGVDAQAQAQVFLTELEAASMVGGHQVGLTLAKWKQEHAVLVVMVPAAGVQEYEARLGRVISNRADARTVQVIPVGANAVNEQEPITAASPSSAAPFVDTMTATATGASSSAAAAQPAGRMKEFEGVLVVVTAKRLQEAIQNGASVESIHAALEQAGFGNTSLRVLEDGVGTTHERSQAPFDGQVQSIASSFVEELLLRKEKRIPIIFVGQEGDFVQSNIGQWFTAVKQRLFFKTDLSPQAIAALFAVDGAFRKRCPRGFKDLQEIVNALTAA